MAAFQLLLVALVPLLAYFFTNVGVNPSKNGPGPASDTGSRAAGATGGGGGGSEPQQGHAPELPAGAAPIFLVSIGGTLVYLRARMSRPKKP